MNTRFNCFPLLLALYIQKDCRLKEVSGRYDFRANLEISAYDRVITLSTCAYRFENARYVLHGKLVEL